MDSQMRDQTFTKQQCHLTTSIETLVEATLHILFQGPNIRSAVLAGSGALLARVP